MKAKKVAHKRGTINLAMPEGPRSVAGTIIGPLAVHRMVNTYNDDMSNSWAVSHVPTGLGISKHLPRKRDAVALTHSLLERFAWDFPTESEAPEDMRAHARQFVIEWKRLHLGETGCVQP